ncbi:MAG: 4Fe-4S binding protein [Actinomycetota bacterium]|nr:4Fe-4S binding protein [Actinomycetota bacterium]
MSDRSALSANRIRRAGGFLVGMLLFYAPFALLIRLVAFLAPATAPGRTISDVHTACLRMPIGWLSMPWMWPSLSDNPFSWLPLLVLPLVALVAGPLFCGWLCPAGAVPEYLGRLVPDRFKFDFKGRVDIVGLRYGFFIGFLLAPFITASVCCALCNFSHMQSLISAATGDPVALIYISTMGVIGMVLWLIVLGAFTLGGRGWCLFLCPAGTAMALVSALTRRLPFSLRVREDPSACQACGCCSSVCSMRALKVNEGSSAAVEHHLCISCLDCVNACPSGALRYGRIKDGVR